MELEQLNGLDISMFGDTDIGYMKGEYSNSGTRIFKYSPTDINEWDNLEEFFKLNKFEVKTNYARDCMGSWYSVYQEYDYNENVIYDIQYINC